jgi:glycosyltransferase involved in cell wall biosynthesis
MAKPSVSVIIPYYNSAKFIEGALESVRRQCYDPLEIILIDDGSTDGIAEKVKEWGGNIIFLQQQNKGPAAARNKGIRQASGDIIAFLDADDRWPDNKLELQLKRLEQDPELGMVTGRIQYIRLEGGEDKVMVHLKDNTLVHVHLGAAVVRRWVFDRLGLFDETMRFHEDQDWYLRIREHRIKMAIMKEVTLLYQLHESNMTRDLNLVETHFLKMLKNSIDRRKALYNGEALNLPPFSVHDDDK